MAGSGGIYSIKIQHWWLERGGLSARLKTDRMLFDKGLLAPLLEPR